MTNCVIRPIPIFVSPSNRSHFTYFVEYNRPFFVTGYLWYIEGAKETILVDSAADPAYLDNLGLTNHQVQTLEAGLDKVGINANDVDMIIQTQLHFDHVGLASRFPNARVVVQKRELDFARDPHPTWGWLYDGDLYENLNLEVIEGDLKISDDVEILSTPGHSPGGQSVSVKTEAGTAVIAGLCSVLENYYPPDLPEVRGLPVIVPEIHTDVFEAYASLMRIKEIADIILPIHDQAFLRKSRIPE